MTEELLIWVVNPIIDNIGIYFLVLIIGLKIISLMKDMNKLNKQKCDDDKHAHKISPHATKDFHEFLKFIITETCVIEFQRFKMENDMIKINRSSVQQLVSTTADKVFQSLSLDAELYLNDNLLTEQYYMNYIVDVSMVTIEKLMDDSISEIAP